MNVVDAFMNRNSGCFLLQRYARRPDGFRVATGNFILVSGDEMAANGLERLKNLLHSRHELHAEKAEIERFPPTARRKFVREHKLVSVQLSESGQLTLDPMKHEGNGWMTACDEPMVLPREIGASVFYEQLLAAFDRSD